MVTVRSSAEIAYAALQDVRIGQHDLLTGLAAQPGRLDADVLDLAREGIDGQGIADDERLVERDRQRGEQIPEHVLQGKSHCDTAHS